MTIQQTSMERIELLAEVGEMQYLEEMTQSEIAKKNCVERSMDSAMLTEASNPRIIEFRFINSTQTTKALRTHQNIQETLNLARQSDLILTGIGNTEPEFSRDYNPGYKAYQEIDLLRAAKVVGDTFSLILDLHGSPDGPKLQE